MNKFSIIFNNNINNHEINGFASYFGQGFDYNFD